MSSAAMPYQRTLVEMIGPPGVGKSTLYRAICQAWTPAQNWTHQHSLLAPPAPPLRQTRKWAEHHLRSLLGKRKPKSIPVDYGLRFIGQHEQLAAVCWDHLSTSAAAVNRELDKRYKSAYFLFDDFCRYQAIQEKALGKPCLIDEGLFQKSFLADEAPQAMQAALQRYLPLIPLPRAIFYLTVQNDAVLTERLLNRGKVIASHKGKNEEELRIDTQKWQHMLSSVLQYMQEQGVPVHQLDTELPIAHNVQKAKGILNQL